MMIAAITTEQAEQLRGQMYRDNSYFEPFEIDGQWFISEQEVKYCDRPDFAWVNDLTLQQIEQHDQADGDH